MTVWNVLFCTNQEPGRGKGRQAEGIGFSSGRPRRCVRELMRLWASCETLLNGSCIYINLDM